MPEDLEARLTDLEAQLAHNARTVDDLNEVVTAQADLIDRLTRKVQALTEKLEDIAEMVEPGHVIGKPPHY
ncbi:SlyX family protein [Rhizobiales bacterium]|uniref:SlyX family protein n=1 Tax=Hongsoonwoonella zoysiae TaxID=2821844 RepID=UPI00155FFE36|nr:SlyX family protein [Hongsoonwoonella zoysiae]NRG19852.1 SlyX family protein [Hongsoonwoonella zoysiae]